MQVQNIRKGVHQQNMDHSLSLLLSFQFVALGAAVWFYTGSLLLGILACLVPLILIAASEVLSIIGVFVISLSWASLVALFCLQSTMGIGYAIAYTLIALLVAGALNYRGARGLRELV